ARADGTGQGTRGLAGGRGVRRGAARSLRSRSTRGRGGYPRRPGAGRFTVSAVTPRLAPLRLGSRRSPMAIAQSRQVAGMITERTGRAVEIVGVTTLGDVSRAQLTQIGGTGVFVSALREALLGGEVDLAVHSLKDLPTQRVGPAAGIALAAVPPRDDPRDALVARDGAKLADLPPGARIGTGSPRRAAQLLALRADLRCVPIRGNAGTRLGKVSEGEL